jgi:MFS family permease
MQSAAETGTATTGNGANHATLPMKAIVAVVIGNWLEFYDFLVFTFFAVMIGDAFFPGESSIGRLLGALATFGVGFFTRPLGAAVIGAYSDKAGRRAALTLTLLLMAVGSGLVAFTPSYAQIGLTAPIILVIARLIQGFSCGGEVGPATTYLLESAPPEKRAMLTAWQGYSQQLAILVGSLVGVVLTSLLTKQQLYGWGWRIPFALGVVIAPVALYIRGRLPETIQETETHASGKAVLASLARYHWPAVTLGIFIISGSTISTYVFNYMNTYAVTTLHLSEKIGTIITLTGAVASIGGMAAGAWLDRLGRKAMLIASRAIFLAMIYPAYLTLTSADATPGTIVAVNMILNFVFSTGIGGLYAFLLEAFPKAVRSSGLAIMYALSVTIFGGTTQFIVTWLIGVTKNPLVPAWYQIVANIASILAIALLRQHADVVGEQRRAGSLSASEAS